MNVETSLDAALRHVGGGWWTAFACLALALIVVGLVLWVGRE